MHHPRTTGSRIFIRGATLLAGVLLFGSATLHAQTAFRQLQELERARLQAGAETQEQIEQLDDRRLDLVGQYRVVLKQRRDLEKYNEQLRSIVQSQLEEQQSLRRQIARVGNLERDIVPLMTDMLDALENFVELDLPFFLAERRQRIVTLRKLMGRSDINNSEKYRRIMEAYQIENDYGRSLEAEQAALSSSDSEQQVVFLKVGRLALYYQTLDGRQTYRWDSLEKKWRQLDKDYNKAIKQGIRMAREQIPVDLLALPLQMPQTF